MRCTYRYCEEDTLGDIPYCSIRCNNLDNGIKWNKENEIEEHNVENPFHLLSFSEQQIILREINKRIDEEIAAEKKKEAEEKSYMP